MKVRLRTWKTPEIQAITDRLKQHQQHRKMQLERMIAYAESNTCRRSIILNHFGDSGIVEAEVCCDNCLARQSTQTTTHDLGALSQSERVALILLDMTHRLPRGVGREKTAQILKGSKAKDIQHFGYDKSLYYGRLAVFSLVEIKKMIDQLLEMGYLKMIGGKYPILRLTPQGEAAIQGKTAIPIKLPRQISNAGIQQIVALGESRSASATVALKRLSPAKKAETISTDTNQQKQIHPSEDPIAAFISCPHPRQLPGPWEAGWALGFHSQFTGADWKRSETGELAYRLKYQGDLSVLPALVNQAATMVADHPELALVDAIVPVPPSKPRLNDPVSSFSEALAQRLDLAFLPMIIKSRQTAPQKEMHTMAQKRVNVAGAFDLQSPIKDKHLLVIDDLFDSGATLEEITRLLRRAGAARVCVLTLTRTIHSDA